jgi:hypothetical protein
LAGTNFAVDPTSLKQSFYDGLHRHVDKDLIKTLKCIHVCLINFYELNMAESQRKKWWTRSVVMANFAYLRSVHQVGNEQ